MPNLLEKRTTIGLSFSPTSEKNKLAESMKINKFQLKSKKNQIIKSYIKLEHIETKSFVGGRIKLFQYIFLE